MSGGIWLTSDGAARVCNGALLVSTDPCAAVCGGGTTPGPCCVDAPGLSLYWDDRQPSLARLIDSSSLQLNRMPLGDSGSSGVCALINGNFTNADTNPQVALIEGSCNIAAEYNSEYSTDLWTALVGALAPDPKIFHAKASGLDFVVVRTNSYVAVPSHLWPNGVVTPYAYIETTVDVQPTWMISDGTIGGNTAFPSWRGTSSVSTQMPASAAQVITGDPSGYIGVQMGGSTSVSHNAGCNLGTYNWPQTTNSVTGGVYYTDGGSFGLLDFRFNFTGVEEVNTTYPQFGPTVFNSYNRFYSFSQCSLRIFSLSSCAGAPAAQFGTLDSAVRRIAFVEKSVSRISGVSGKVLSSNTTTTPMDPRIADAMLRQQSAMGIPCCNQ